MIIKAANDDGIFSLSFFGHIIIMTITANPMHIVGISGWKPSVKYEINLVIARLPLDAVSYTHLDVYKRQVSAFFNCLKSFILIFFLPVFVLIFPVV